MPIDSEARVAVYIDFDNILISRYDQLHGRGAFHSDKVRTLPVDGRESKARTRFAEATVDLGAIIDYASSYGSIVLSRAYADWSVPAHAAYRDQLLARAVDLVQLFPTTRSLKNGADIRLSIDVVEDLFRLDDITHIVVVAGDSDYIALAQRVKRLGRFMVGIGVAGSTSKSLAAACDEFADYDALPGVQPVVLSRDEEPGEPDAPEPTPAEAKRIEAEAVEAAATKPPRRRRRATSESVQQERDEVAMTPEQRGEAATGLLERALRILHQKGDDEWLHANVVKEQMKRMDPVFNEKSLGHRSFSDFVAARDALVEVREEGQARLLRLRRA
ncbi:NYN domain-containing protein [Agrococcus sp. HG114]|uniref:NYN domain-containing protein n=1 Tax=Agrococcus sp. HG114 TaxID=2969757 RepID=UPI00215B51DA|nr:NYN domain-containing protein [Agrococcus sp. HG114]MCR8669758.1 NYN domain-containing protein [Agrococcus sp. HG114]